jgi:hypothetical protein
MKFYSKIGGFYSDDPYGERNMKSKPVTLRTNNPGAINRSSWQKDLPGYLGNYITSYSTVNGKKVPNYTTFYASPEEGVIAYWWLLKRYRDNYNVRMTPKGIITTYGGGQNYTGYLRYITNLGFRENQTIDLYDDSVLLPFAKAMFRYEAGVPIPWSDAQILYGFNAARGIEKAQKATGKPLGEVSRGPSYTPTTPPDKSAVRSVLAPLAALAGTAAGYILGGIKVTILLAIVGILCYIVYKRYWK